MCVRGGREGAVISTVITRAALGRRGFHFGRKALPTPGPPECSHNPLSRSPHSSGKGISYPAGQLTGETQGERKSHVDSGGGFPGSASAALLPRASPGVTRLRAAAGARAGAEYLGPAPGSARLGARTAARLGWGEEQWSTSLGSSENWEGGGRTRPLLRPHPLLAPEPSFRLPPRLGVLGHGWGGSGVGGGKRWERDRGGAEGRRPPTEMSLLSCTE